MGVTTPKDNWINWSWEESDSEEQNIDEILLNLRILAILNESLKNDKIAKEKRHCKN